MVISIPFFASGFFFVLSVVQDAVQELNNKELNIKTNNDFFM
jgi:hypothetical protein